MLIIFDANDDHKYEHVYGHFYNRQAIAWSECIAIWSCATHCIMMLQCRFRWEAGIRVCVCVQTYLHGLRNGGVRFVLYCELTLNTYISSLPARTRPLVSCRHVARSFGRDCLWMLLGKPCNAVCYQYRCFWSFVALEWSTILWLLILSVQYAIFS